jgi:hypothetical protein
MKSRPFKTQFISKAKLNCAFFFKYIYTFKLIKWHPEKDRVVNGF